MTKSAVYTWEQVAQHTDEKSAWIYSRDTVYDITPWLSKHPGGTQVLLLAAGRDCTDLLVSYHPFAVDKVQKTLDSYAIGKIEKKEFPQFAPDSGFYKEVCEKVGNFFKKTGKDYKDPFPAIFRMISVVSLGLLAISLCWNTQIPWTIRMLAAALFGLCQALPLLQVMHDASHFAISRIPALWFLIGRFTMDVYAGASLCSWHHQHILGHHIYTNILGVDPDLPVSEIGDVRRITLFQNWIWPYQFQVLYLPILYGLLGFKQRVSDFTATMMSHSSGAVRVSSQDIGFYASQISTKLIWFSWRFLLPVFLLRVPISDLIVLTLISEYFTGAYLAYNFQVSHISPDAVFPPKKSKIDDEWAVVQVKSSVDYAHNDLFMTFMSGALNYQTVHHLFPCVAQHHYPAIAPIILEVCKKWGIQFNVLPTFWSAFEAHLRHLHTLGNKQKA